MKTIDVGILGGTGMVGQHFIRFLQGHPWFNLTWLGASDRSSGKKLKDATSWRLDGDIPSSAAEIIVSDSKPSASAPRLMFSAMDASVATEIERAFAQAGHIIVSNSRNHRMEADVPLIVPEVNPGHLELLRGQQKARGWKGMIVTNPNCSTIVLTMALAPLVPFGIEKVIVATLQAISGAGYPGVASMDIMANIVPFIGAEEEKMQQETQKILGTFSNGAITPLPRASARIAIASPLPMATSSPPPSNFQRSPPPLMSRPPLKTSRAFRSSASFPARRRSRSPIYRKPTVLNLAAMPCAKTVWASPSAVFANALCSISNSLPVVTTPFVALPEPPCSTLN
jgi:hypothetical protein